MATCERIVSSYFDNVYDDEDYRIYLNIGCWAYMCVYVCAMASPNIIIIHAKLMRTDKLATFFLVIPYPYNADEFARFIDILYAAFQFS